MHTDNEYAIELQLSGTPAELAARLRQLATKVERAEFLATRNHKGAGWVHGIQTAGLRVNSIER